MDEKSDSPFTASHRLEYDVLHSMRDAVLTMDNQGGILMLNPVGERLLNVSAQEAVGHAFSEIFVLRGDLEAFNDCILKAIYDPSTPHTSEIQITRAGSNKPMHLVVRTNLLVSEDGQAEGVVAVIADISERVRMLAERVEQQRLQNQFGQFFIYIMSIFTIGTLVNYALHTYLTSIDVYGEFFKWAYLAIIIVPSVITIRNMGIPWDELGVTTRNWRKSLIEGVVVAALAVLIIYLLTRGMKMAGVLPGTERSLLGGSLIGFLAYILHAAIQELLIRGVIQSSFEKFYNDTKGYKSVILASVFGGVLHIHFGFSAVLILFIAGIPFGAFYLRHHNLIGVTILHTMAGTAAFLFGLM